jgi:hypothetical protein
MRRPRMTTRGRVLHARTRAVRSRMRPRSTAGLGGDALAGSYHSHWKSECFCTLHMARSTVGTAKTACGNVHFSSRPTPHAWL